MLRVKGALVRLSAGGGLARITPNLMDYGTLSSHYKVELGRVWQDTAGTVAATADGESVKRLDAGIVGLEPLLWTSGTAPVLRNTTRWGIEWSGTSAKLFHTSSVVSGSNAFSAFMVATYGSITGVYKAPFWLGTYTNSTGYGLAYRTPAAQIETALHSGGGAITGAGPANGDRTLIDMGYAGGAGGAHEVWRDAVSLGSTTMSANLGVGLCLGDDSNGTALFAGRVHEVVFYNANLSATNRAGVRNIMKNTWATP